MYQNNGPDVGKRKIQKKKILELSTTTSVIFTESGSVCGSLIFEIVNV